MVVDALRHSQQFFTHVWTLTRFNQYYSEDSVLFKDLVSLEPATPLSYDNHSTTKPLCFSDADEDPV